MKRLNVEVCDVEEAWGDYLPYEDVIMMLRGLKELIDDGFGSVAVDEIDKQLKEWGEGL